MVHEDIAPGGLLIIQSDNNMDLGDLFEHIWGYQPAAFNPKFDAVHGDDITDLERVEYGTVGGSPYYDDDDVTGLEYFLPVSMTYSTKSGGVGWAGAPGAQNDMKTIFLPNPIISISGKKKIVKTPLTDRSGTVKEYISREDYVISIKGIIIGDTNEFPEAGVTVLRELYESNYPVSIANPITDIFLLRPDRSGSDSVVITDLKFPEVKGIKNVRAYELTMESDEPFNLIDIS
jgi:hypothetical protein